MAIFTFSTKDSKPADEALVREVKKYCDSKGLIFSSVVIAKLKEWHECQTQQNTQP